MSRPVRYDDRYERDPRERGGRDPRDLRDRDSREPQESREQRRIDPRDLDRMDTRDPARIDPRTTRDAAARTMYSYADPGREDAPTGRYMDEPRDRQRNPIDLQPADRRREETVSRYQEYFVPGQGINREVIQTDICRYLGNDATVRPYQHADGRHGFVVKAYRAPTTPMLETLKEDSRRFEAEAAQRRHQFGQSGTFATSATFDDRQRQGRPDTRPEAPYPPGYADYPMDMDYEDDREISRGYSREQDSRIDPRQDPRQDQRQDPRQDSRLDQRQDPRQQQQPPMSRHGQMPVSQGYPIDQPYSSGYTVQPVSAYSGYDPRDPNIQPRTLSGTTNTTPPPMGRAGQPPYPGGYPVSTSAPPGAAPVRYADPAVGRPVVGYQPYPGGGRHDRR